MTSKATPNSQSLISLLSTSDELSREKEARQGRRKAGIYPKRKDKNSKTHKA